MKTWFLLLLIALAPAAAAEDALVDYIVENAAAIPAPLAEGGDAATGPAVFAEAQCAGCHATPENEDAPPIGPDLSGVGARLTEGEIRLMVVAPMVPFPNTEMPGYYIVGEIGEVPDELVGRTRLSALEIEHLVAWLKTLE